MKVEFTFDKEQIQQYGYTVDAVKQTILRGFVAKGLRCTSADDFYRQRTQRRFL